MAKSRQFIFAKKTSALTVFGTMLIMTLILLSACGDSGSSIVGRWDAISIGWVEGGETFTEDVEEGEFILEFFSDGNGAEIEGGRTDSFTWSAENGRLMMTLGRDTVLADYNISGSTLTIAVEESRGTEIVTFRRAN